MPASTIACATVALGIISNACIFRRECVTTKTLDRVYVLIGRATSFRVSVPRVVELRSEKEMVGANAWGIVAAMQPAKVRLHTECVDVRENHRFAVPETSIPIVVPCGRPQPARCAECGVNRSSLVNF